MSDLDSILKTISNAAAAAGDALTLAEKVAGPIGRGGPRWHRWRALRLRLRAVRIEGRRPGKARALRTSAMIHLAHALRMEGYISAADQSTLVSLAAGNEPEARRV